MARHRTHSATQAHCLVMSPAELCPQRVRHAPGRLQRQAAAAVAPHALLAAATRTAPPLHPILLRWQRLLAPGLGRWWRCTRRTPRVRLRVHEGGVQMVAKDGL